MACVVLAVVMWVTALGVTEARVEKGVSRRLAQIQASLSLMLGYSALALFTLICVIDKHEWASDITVVGEGFWAYGALAIVAFWLVAATGIYLSMRPANLEEGRQLTGIRPKK